MREKGAAMTKGQCDADSDRDATLPALMLGYCRGEREAFERLYSRVAPSILAELVELSGDRQRAEALLDRTLQVLHECRASYVAGADPRPWIHQLAHRTFAIDCRRRSAETRPFWSRVRTMLTGAAPVEVEARS